MKTLHNHIILFDNECPMCYVYTKAFVKTGMLAANGRAAYQQTPAGICPFVDPQRAANEIALVNTVNGEVTYGIDSLFKVIAHRFPFFKPLFSLRAFAYAMSKIYAFISYNRKVIIPVEIKAHSLQPTFKLHYRIAYLIFTWIVTACILTVFACLLQPLVPIGGTYREYFICGCQIIVQGLIIAFHRKKKLWDYLGNMMTISFAGALLLLPAILYSKYFEASPVIYTLYFLSIAGLMLLEHLRRSKILKIGWLMSVTWVLYRLVVLGLIFFFKVMKYKKIVLAGGNGYLGGLLARHFSDVAEEIIILSRKPAAQQGNIKTLLWDGKNAGNWSQALERADLLVNLCGKNVNCRYTERNRKEIIDSRVIPTMLLGKAVEESAIPPKLWINITSATIYRHAEDRTQDEYTGDIGEGFSVEVCKLWEKSFFNKETLHTRKVALRMGIVLGPGDGAFPRLFNLVRLGLGGKQGNGKQYVNWVYETDAINCIEWLITQDEVSGVVNCTAPYAVNNSTLMRTIRSACGIQFGIPTPAWLLEIGARIIGTETELILKSRWVKPAVLLDNGFAFKYGEIESAVHDIIGRKQRSAGIR